MAKRTNTKDTVNKAQAIRDYSAKHPNDGPAAVVKALAAQGVDVTASRVSTVLRGGSTKKKNGSVDVDTIKKAAEFVKAHGDVDEALKAIEQVGEFITECGNAKKATAALEAYKAMAEVIG